MNRMQRRALLQAFSVAFVAAASPHARANDVSVPVGLQSALIGKVATFERTFRARSGSTARVIIVHKRGDSARVAKQMAQALNELPDIAGVPKSIEMLEWTNPAALTSAVAARPTGLVYFSLDLEAEAPAIAAALAGTNVLTVGATGAMATSGASVGFELEEGRPKIYVN